MVTMSKRADLPVVDPTLYGIRGYASITGVLIPAKSVKIEPGAFGSVLERTPQRIPIHYSHEMWRLELGETRVLREDNTGLWFEGQFFATREAADVLAVISGRGRMGVSFSFDEGEVTESADGIALIRSFSRLYELGPTTYPANPAAWCEVFPLTEAAWHEGAHSAPIPAQSHNTTQLSAAIAALRSL